MALFKIDNLAALSLTLIFAVCGGDNNNSSGPDDNLKSEYDIEAKSRNDLPICSYSNEGSIAFVQKEQAVYTCVMGNWISENAESSSSLKNKASSSSSYKEKSSSSEIRHESDQKSSSSVENKQNTTTEETPPIFNKTVIGLSQKGPLVTGSSVVLYGVDSNYSVVTDKKYIGKVTSDNGKYKIVNVTLPYTYALLSAVGFYKSEVNGLKSSDSIVLNALVDLSKLDSVNINLLTHLECKRIIHLIEAGKSYSDSKKQAQTEILSALNIKGNFAGSENLNLFGKNDGSAVLLAFSILMLHDLNQKDVAKHLEKVEGDIENDGVWSDDSVKTKIADWASTQDLGGGLDSIRDNVESWKLGDVPNFEKYVRNYWYVSYGLGDCSKSREGEILAVKNERSAKYGSKVRYICRDGMWNEASQIEKDTYKWEKGEDGEIKIGDVTKLRYVYDAEQGAWREASVEESAFGGCTETNKGDIAMFSNVRDRWYICKPRQWVVADTIEVDTKGWIAGNDGEIKKGDSTDYYYKYDEASKKWLNVNKNDTTLKLNGCTTNLEGEVKKSSFNESYYVCKKMEWQDAQQIDYDTYGELCTKAKEGKIIEGKKNENNRYFCFENGWIYITIDWSWDVPKEARLNPDISYGSVTDERDGKVYKTVEIGHQVWMSENLNYADTLKTPSLKGKIACKQGKDEYCDIAGRFYRWRAASMNSYKLCSGETCTIYNQGVCPKGWHVPDYGEWKVLFDTVGGISKAAKVLKSKTGWMKDGNGSDAVGFSAIPAGGIIGFGYSEGEGAFFWLPEEHAGNGGCVGLFYNKDGASRVTVYASDEGDLCSIRCIQN